MSAWHGDLGPAPPDAWQKAITADHSIRETRIVTIGIVLALVLILSSMTYCSTRPDEIDPNAQLERLAEVHKSVACSRAGGSWMPVAPPGIRDHPKMSCVKPDALPLVKEMNARADD